MKKLSKGQKRVVRIMTGTAIIAVVIFIAVNYINDYYKATDTAKKALLGSAKIEVIEKDNYYLFTKRQGKISEGNSQIGTEDSGNNSEQDLRDNTKDTLENAEENTKQNLEDNTEDTLEHSENSTNFVEADTAGISKGIVFYPGGKVEETAYAPLLLELAENRYEVYLVKMPAKLAIFGMNLAEDIFKEASHIEEWTMMGHSLGGAMAASFSASHDEEVDALVLLAGYSTENLTDKDMDVYSIYGSEDKVLNMEKYQEYYENLPKDVVEAVIDGGNHAYYGYYGEQDGDGVADITREEQQETVLDIFLSAN